ncbi:E3 ubiquitin-protein ligase SH3RF1-like isoform X1 [Asterias amurensis]|uniref:E3 ubiquitin-protein ligase SH3RF1-like isoform X1 n=1 Tax=Asterias amurensis TaxID=7602 RepID=UPI003AB11FFB
MDEQTIYNLLECSVCLEPLDVTSRVLPCQHTFCMRCLQQIINTRNELKCPECRDVVPCRLVTDLPTNILLVRLLDGLKRPGKAPGSPPPRTSNAGIGGVGGETTVSTRSTSSKNSIQNQPCAMALYKYEAQEHGDLSFNKSDIILLHKRIDDNWYQGVVMSTAEQLLMGNAEQIGFFPASYVQVLTPLPPDPPQCKALYDFEVNEREEKDCLTFTKDEVLNVIRRVDENWVEGKKGDKIGIFPLSFVELNGTAKNLVDAHAGIDRSSGPSHQSQGSGDASSGSPDQAGSSGPEGSSKNKAKRHSFPYLLNKNKDAPPTTSTTTASTSNSSSSNNNSNRHSMEISSPVLLRSSNPTAANLIDSKAPSSSSQAAAGPAAVSTTGGAAPTASTTTVSAGASGVNYRKKPAPLTGISQNPAITSRGPNSPSLAASPTVTPAGNVEFRFGGEAPASPKPKVEVCVAMYSYKPTKGDELELKKGDFYTVTERCKDGWYKGMSVKTGDMGVFPGNYMQPYRHERSARKTPTTVSSTSEGRTSNTSSDSPRQSTSAPTSSSSQGMRPRLPSDAASRANSHRVPSDAPASPSPLQAMRPRVLSDAGSRMSSQRIAADLSTASSTPVSLSSATTQTSSSRTCANASRATGQSAQPKSPSPIQTDRRTVSQIPDGQKTVAQLQSERAAQQSQFRPPPPNQSVRPGVSAMGQTRPAGHSERTTRGSPPTVGTQTAAVTARTNTGQSQPPSRHLQGPSPPLSVRQRVPVGQAVAGSPPTHNGVVQRVRSPSSPQQDSAVASDAERVVKPRGSPVMGQGSPRGAVATPSATPPLSTPPQVEHHMSAKSKRYSATEARLQQAPKPRRHSESDNDPVRSRRTLLAKTNSHQHPPQCNPQMHPLAPGPAAQQQSGKALSTTAQPHPNGKQTTPSSSGQQQTKPNSPSVHRVFDLSPFSTPPNSTAPDCSAPSLGNPGKIDKKEKKDRKVSKKRPQGSTEDGAPIPLTRGSSLPDGQELNPAEPGHYCPSPGLTVPSTQPPSTQPPSTQSQGDGSGEETPPVVVAAGVSDGASGVTERRDKPPKTTPPLVRERYRVVVPYPPHSEAELELKVGETVFVHNKREDGWFKGTQQRTGKTGLFPGSFVESF